MSFTILKCHEVGPELPCIYLATKSFSSRKASRIGASEGTLIRIFVNVRTAAEYVLFWIFKKALGSLRSICWILLKKLLTTRRIICAARSETFPATNRRNGPLRHDGIVVVAGAI